MNQTSKRNYSSLYIEPQELGIFRAENDKCNLLVKLRRTVQCGYVAYYPLEGKTLTSAFTICYNVDTLHTKMMCPNDNKTPVVHIK